MLIDCGASHNFVSAELVQKLGLRRIETLGYGVIMGTGVSCKVKEYAEGYNYPFKMWRW